MSNAQYLCDWIFDNYCRSTTFLEPTQKPAPGVSRLICTREEEEKPDKSIVRSSYSKVSKTMI